MRMLKQRVGDILVNIESSDAIVDHLLRELGEDTVSTASIREDTIEEHASESFYI